MVSTCRILARRPTTTFVLTCAVSLSACSAEDIICGGVGTPGIVLNVVDAADRRALTPSTVVVRQLDAPFTTMTGTADEALRIAVNAGRYEVSVTVPSYRSVTDTIAVANRQSDGCEVIYQQATTIALTRLP